MRKQLVRKMIKFISKLAVWFNYQFLKVIVTLLTKENTQVKKKSFKIKISKYFWSKKQSMIMKQVV